MTSTDLTPGQKFALPEDQKKSTMLLSNEPITTDLPNTSKDLLTENNLEYARDAVLQGCISTRGTTASDDDEFEDEELETSLFKRKSSAKAKTLSARLLRNIDRKSANSRKYSEKKVHLDDDNEVFDPEKFRLIPMYVFVARRLDPNLFSRIIYFFFERKRWPLCSELPHQVNRFCRLWGIAGEFKDMPAFAPEWVFHLQLMNNSSFWSVIRYFFRFSKFPSWDIIPSLYTDWFEKLELGEFEYPSITKFDKIPEDVKKRYKILMEWRLKLTEMQFPKGKDHFAMEISSKNTEGAEDPLEYRIANKRQKRKCVLNSSKEALKTENTLRYGMAVAYGHINPLFPYISDMGSTAPESCLFSMGLSTATIFLVWMLYVRHVQTQSALREERARAEAEAQAETGGGGGSSSGRLRRWRRGELCGLVAALSAPTMCVGILMVANFQKTHCNLSHLVGAFLYIGAGAVYACCQVELGKDAMKWKQNDGGFEYHVVAVVGQWLIVLCHSCFVGTFCCDLKGRTLIPPVIKDLNPPPPQPLPPPSPASSAPTPRVGLTSSAPQTGPSPSAASPRARQQPQSSTARAP
ncbi:DNA damage-regulated autophagy modulator protein 2 [Gryllus bimaculatus]|nr:DNA damage-regulated autophagy modulator protein 2 [Gryllus bimaculatus]